jgi:hypothetical protein
MAMPRYAYKINPEIPGGISDLRFVQDDYQPEEGEIVKEGEPLPDPKSLPEYREVEAKPAPEETKSRRTRK